MHGVGADPLTSRSCRNTGFESANGRTRCSELVLRLQRNDRRSEKLALPYSFHFFGSFCLSVYTSADRSPILSTRLRVSSQRKTSLRASFFFDVVSTSSQVTGVETVGCSRARSE